MLLEKNIDLSFLLQSYITEYAQDEIDFIKMDKSKAAIEYIKHNDVDLIITEEDLNQGTGSEVYSFLRENKNDIFFLLTTARNYDDIKEYSSFYEDSEYNAFMRKPYDLKVLNSTLEKVLDKKVNNEGYCRISKKIFKKYPHFNSAIYLKLGDGKYVKMSSGSRNENDMDELGRIFSKEIKYIYMEKADYIVYVDSLLANLSGEEFEESFVFINEIINNFPVSEEIIQVINESIEDVKSKIKKGLNQEVLDNLLESESYLAKHSELLAYIQSYIIDKLNWGAHNKQIIDKAVKAAYIHDLFMIAEDEKDINHIRKAVSFVRDNFNDGDLEKIIQQHHEKPDGLGYPTKMTYQTLQPLSACFILSHDLAFAVSEKRDLLSWYYKRSNYYLGSFDKPYKAIKGLVVELEEMLRTS